MCVFAHALRRFLFRKVGSQSRQHIMRGLHCLNALLSFVLLASLLAFALRAVHHRVASRLYSDFRLLMFGLVHGRFVVVRFPGHGDWVGARPSVLRPVACAWLYGSATRANCVKRSAGPPRERVPTGLVPWQPRKGLPHKEGATSILGLGLGAHPC